MRWAQYRETVYSERSQRTLDHIYIYKILERLHNLYKLLQKLSRKKFSYPVALNEVNDNCSFTLFLSFAFF